MDVSVLINLERFSRIPRTRKESCEYLGLTSVTYAIQSRVLPLVETGQIKMSIPEKPKSPKTVYFTVNNYENICRCRCLPGGWAS